MLATKATLGIRIDSLTEEKDETGAFGMEQRIKLENKVRKLEGKPLLPKAVNIAPSTQVQPSKWELKEAQKYNHDVDTAVDIDMEDAPAISAVSAGRVRDVVRQDTPESEGESSDRKRKADKEDEDKAERKKAKKEKKKDKE